MAPWEAQTPTTPEFHLGVIRQDERESKGRVKSFSRSLEAIADLIEVVGAGEQSRTPSGELFLPTFPPIPSTRQK